MTDAYPDRVADVLAAARCVIGAVMITLPVTSARILGTERGTASRASWTMVMVGARELALGFGSLVRRGDSRSWLLAQAVADGGDAFAIVSAVARRQLPRWPAVLVAAAAVGGVVGELVTAADADAGR